MTVKVIIVFILVHTHKDNLVVEVCTERDDDDDGFDEHNRKRLTGKPGHLFLLYTRRYMYINKKCLRNFYTRLRELAIKCIRCVFI